MCVTRWLGIQLKNGTLCFLNTLFSLMMSTLSTLTACISFFFFLSFWCTTYCMQRDSLLILCGASLDIGGLFFKTNAKWKGSIALQRPDRWCTNSQVLVSLYSVVCTSKKKKRKLALLWTVDTEDPCVLCAYSHHHSVLLTATAIWDCRPHHLLRCCLLCCYSDISFLNKFIPNKIEKNNTGVMMGRGVAGE